MTRRALATATWTTWTLLLTARLLGKAVIITAGVFIAACLIVIAIAIAPTPPP